MTASTSGSSQERGAQWWLVAICWLAVGIPLTWGVWMTVKKALLLFQ